jgi:hypothetical protein
MASLADYSLDSSDDEYVAHGVRRKNKNELIPSNLKDYDVIFVKTDFIVRGTFQRDYLNNINTKFILITGTSDYSLDINENFKTVLSSPYLVHWFACNPPFNDYEKISFIPIGFQEYERLGEQIEILKSFQKSRLDFTNKKNKIYIPYHSQTNGSRRNMILQLSQFDFVEVEQNKLDLQSYLNKISEYKFVLSLRGNGWDCHRHYEILLCGSVPVMERGPIQKNFEKLGIPYLDLNFIDTQIFNSNFNFYNVKNFLTLDFYSSLIKNVTK